MSEEHCREGSARFYPVMAGCVATDLRMARAMTHCCREELRAVSRYTQCSLLFAAAAPVVSRVLGELAEDARYHVTLLEELVRALGACPSLPIQTCSESPDLGEVAEREREQIMQRLLRELLREKKRGIDRYQTLMGSTSDRVVRSVLAGVLDDEQRHFVRLRTLLDACR